MIDLSELEHDTISELINIGVGRAASSLSEMVEQPVELTVPRITFVERFSDTELAKAPTEVVSAVSQTFDGPFKGEAMLVFPEERSLELVPSWLQQVEADSDLDCGHRPCGIVVPFRSEQERES